MRKVDLPKKYEYQEGVTNPLYKKYDGWNKISYSQFTSFLDEEDDGYRKSYIMGYFVGKRDEGNEFTYFGSACGDYLNIKDQRVDSYLTKEDTDVMDALIAKHPDEADFEFEIVIDLEPFGLEKTCMQGFSDRQHLEEALVHINDYKTVNLEKKRDYYLSEKYRQTRIYGYGLEELGYSIGRTYVTALGRKGNELDKNALHKNGKTRMGIRLSGEVEELDTPYNREEAKKFLKEVVDVCIKIDDYYKVYNKYLAS